MFFPSVLDDSMTYLPSMNRVRDLYEKCIVVCAQVCNWEILEVLGWTNLNEYAQNERVHQLIVKIPWFLTDNFPLPRVVGVDIRYRTPIIRWYGWRNKKQTAKSIAL